MEVLWVEELVTVTAPQETTTVYVLVGSDIYMSTSNEGVI